VEPDDGSEKPRTPEQRLWLAVLCLMLEDARRYVEGVNVRLPYGDQGRNAFNQVSRCGEQLRRICDYLPDLDAETISEHFRRWMKKSGQDLGRWSIT
jgi:hypothetical protein